MASSRSYLDFILEQLRDLDDISYKPMMGEFIIYYRGKIVGGIYDDRFLVKPVKAAVTMMPDAELELPYEGAKNMILVDKVEDLAEAEKDAQGGASGLIAGIQKLVPQLNAAKLTSASFIEGSRV